MTYKYEILLVKSQVLEPELKNMGIKGWELVTIVLLQTMKQGVRIDGAPIIELQYQLFFKKPENETTN